MTIRPTTLALREATLPLAVAAGARELAHALMLNFARWWLSRLQDWRARRELNALSDAGLRDIGLSRCAIDAVVADNFR